MPWGSITTLANNTHMQRKKSWAEGKPSYTYCRPKLADFRERVADIYANGTHHRMLVAFSSSHETTGWRSVHSIGATTLWDASPPTSEITGTKCIWSPTISATGCRFMVPKNSLLNSRGEGKRGEENGWNMGGATTGDGELDEGGKGRGSASTPREVPSNYIQPWLRQWFTAHELNWSWRTPSWTSAALKHMCSELAKHEPS